LDFFETSKSQFQKNSKSGSREPGTSTDFPDRGGVFICPCPYNVKHDLRKMN
jgi:hypothetical protein